MNDRESFRAARAGGSVVPALLVIAIGAFFLLDNLGIHIGFLDLRHWWAWLIMAAALAPLSTAAQRYREVGAVDGVVLNSLLNAAVIVMVALMFLLQPPWRQWWPLFMICGGLYMLARSWKGPDGGSPER